MTDFNAITTLFLQTPSGHMALMLLSRRGLEPSTLMRLMHEQVSFVLPAMQPGARYTSRDLSDAHLWRSFSFGTRHAAGMCLRQLVKTGELPLQQVVRKGGIKYRLTRSAFHGGEDR